MTPSIIAPKRRPSLLIIGCGDVGMRVLRLLRGRWRVYALTSSPDRAEELRAADAIPLIGNLDDQQSLGRLAGLSQRVLYLAPPPSAGVVDTRLEQALRALSRGGQVTNFVYASTTGVYGDCQGASIDETRAVAPQTARAVRRTDAEARTRFFGRRTGASVSILRIPGIYATDREGGHPRDRLIRGTPVLHRDVDVYTNHIQADDLARACLLALLRGRPQRVINVCDDSDLMMGDYFDLVAELSGLPKPKRVSLTEAKAALTAMQWSFMGESRRIGNARLKKELRLNLRYPGVRDALG